MVVATTTMHDLSGPYHVSESTIWTHGNREKRQGPAVINLIAALRAG